MWSELREVVFGNPPLEIEHDFFGRLRCMGDAKSGDGYWEAQHSPEPGGQPLTLVINAPASGFHGAVC